MCAKCRYRLDDVVIPTILPIGEFKPLKCCICGNGLGVVRFEFREGSICMACYTSLPEGVKAAWREFIYPEGVPV